MISTPILPSSGELIRYVTLVRGSERPDDSNTRGEIDSVFIGINLCCKTVLLC